jgi:tRNA pseudouridine38-40 synthase
LRTVKIVLGFQGTRYEGWQSQRNGKTLQEVFEKVLTRIFGHDTPIVGSSRTDSGVHALAFAAHFRAQSKLPDAKIKQALNFYLPPDIVVFSAKSVGAKFHARFSAKHKLYRYSIWNDPTRPLFEAPFVLWHPKKLNVSNMKKAAKALVGRHDFSAFCDKGGDERHSYVRKIRSLKITRSGKQIHIDISANGFLRHMVRILAGTLLEVGRGKMKPEAVRAALHSKDRAQAGPTAKALGLTLIRVTF